MQGEGMSLSAPEKVRVVKALDDLGVQMIEAGFPTPIPRKRSFRFARGGRSPACRRLRLRDDAAARDRGRRRSGAAHPDRSFAPVLTLVGKTWAVHLEKVTKVSREENLAMIAESVAFCRERGKRVRLRRRALLRRLPRGPGYALSCLEAAIDAGARTSPSVTPTGPASGPDRGGDRVAVARFGERAEIGIHAHDDAGCGSQQPRRGERRGADVQGP